MNSTLPVAPRASKPTAAPRTAVARFLKDIKKAAEKTFPKWQEVLVEGIEECPLTYDTRRAIFDIHPLDDYYFAGAVALEAAKVRQLFGAAAASEVLSLIAESVDAEAGRTDRVVSDLVFHIIGRIETVAADSQKKSYDQVVKAILQRLGLDHIEATAHLMTQALYRHRLGEPLALGVPNWWTAFHTKYDFANATQPVEQQSHAQPGNPAVPVRRRVPRRATAF
jgi:hypothetical protein